MPEKIVKVQASEQYRNDYKEYALYVERHRTVPEFRDGLKPVQRRIVYAAYNDVHAVSKTKSSEVVGTTMGKYHPHGDDSIKNALYCIVNWYQTKIPLFDGQGNFGNMFNNIPAAPRYTEVKLSNFALDCILDELIQCREIVDWEDNFSNTLKEPSYLPVKVPLLLINGSYGIAVGDKVDIPSHNINEVIDATINLINNPNSNVVLVPDHCQSCEIVDTDWESICNKGYGNYKVRGVIDIEPYKGEERKYRDLMTLVIKSCPNLTFLETVIEKLEEMVKKNKIIGIADVEEQSYIDSKTGKGVMRYVIILKPGIDPNYIRNEIYKNTSMMQTARVNFKVLDIENKENLSQRVSYKGYLSAWIEFRKLSKFRLFENKLQKLMTRLHMINTYIWAIESGEADNIINIIKNSKSVDDNELIETLIKKCNITDIQAKFFINCEIKKLSKSYYSKYKNEQAKLIQETEFYRNAIAEDGVIEKIIIDELLQIKAKYGEPRKCKIISESEVTGVPCGEFKIVITENNFIKKIGLNDVISRPKNDNIKFVVSGDNSKSLLLFDSIGKVYNVPISKIPFSNKNSNGIDIRLINKNINASITSVIYEDTLVRYENGCIVTLTKNGYIKRISAIDFLSVPPSGLVYCKIDPDDSIIDLILFGNNNAELIIYGKNKALRVDINDIPLLKRNARGCSSMTTNNGQPIVEGMFVLSRNTSSIIVVTKNGYFNRVIPDSITKGRAKRGSNVIKLNKNDQIVSILGISQDENLNIMTAPNGEVITINTSSIPNGATVSSGTRLITGKQIVNVQK